MSSLIPYFINAGAIGVFLVLFLLGFVFSKSAMDEKNAIIKSQQDQIQKLEHALELERMRSDAGVMAATVVKDVMQALRKEITQ